MDQGLFDFLTNEGYFDVREIPGHGYCGLHRMMFTVGLFVMMDRGGYDGRYCYPDLRSAIDGIREWDGVGHPPGPWIKYKGSKGDFGNPRENDEIKIA